MKISPLAQQFAQDVRRIQDEICAALEGVDGEGKFREDLWDRPEGGGGRTRVLSEGAVFEKGGVAVSAVHGQLPEVIQKRFGVEQSGFFATGVSLVIHPRSPMVPTVHANFRFFELYESPEGGKAVDAWFGGGADLTPYYVNEDDCRHFHQALRAPCDKHDATYYPKFKAACDDYFFNSHRGEARGVGGIFFDYMRANDAHSLEDIHAFVVDAGDSFIPAYLPIVKARKADGWTDAQRYFQELRRGRYVEFNLLHDRGTLFGLKTKGRMESILMSLPPRVRWDYCPEVEAGSEEAKLIEILQNPRDWLA